MSDDKMAIWNAYGQTDKAFVKKVNQRGGFSAICAQYQMRCATELWGPYGGEWGMKDCEYGYVQLDGSLPTEAWLEAVFYFPGGEAQVSTDMEYKPKNETRKKLLTDATTKALSKMGFNNDIFMGLFDGNKYMDDDGAVVPRGKAKPPGPKKFEWGTATTPEKLVYTIGMLKPDTQEMSLIKMANAVAPLAASEPDAQVREDIATTLMQLAGHKNASHAAIACIKDFVNSTLIAQSNRDLYSQQIIKLEADL